MSADDIVCRFEFVCSKANIVLHPLPMVALAAGGLGNGWLITYTVNLAIICLRLVAIPESPPALSLTWLLA